MSVLNDLPIKIRLTILTGLLLLVALFVGVMGINGMRNADHAIDELYHKDMAHLHSLGSILAKVEESRSQILLSLQHDPESPFVAMHDHPVSLHIDIIEANIKSIDKHWAEFKSGHLGVEEKRLAGVFDAELNRFEHEAVDKILEGIRTGHYHKLIIMNCND